jgi:hypothetical protein
MLSNSKKFRLSGGQSDRLFKVALKTGEPALIYVLMEHKSTPDPRTPFQLMGYMVRIWERYGEGRRARSAAVPPIIPLVFYHGSDDWTIPTAIIDCIDADPDFKTLIRDFRYTLHDLRHIPDERLASERSSRAGLAALKYVFVADVDVETLARIIRDLPDEGLFLRQVFEYLMAAYEVHEQNLIDAAARAKSGRGEELMQTVAEQIHARGEAKGRAEGRAEGEKHGLIRAILRTLDRRFGPLPPEITAQVENTPPESLENVLDQAVTVSTLDEVFAGTDRH